MSGWSGEHQGENEVRDDLVEVDGEPIFLHQLRYFLQLRSMLRFLAMLEVKHSIYTVKSLGQWVVVLNKRACFS